MVKEWLKTYNLPHDKDTAVNHVLNLPNAWGQGKGMA